MVCSPTPWAGGHRDGSCQVLCAPASRRLPYRCRAPPPRAHPPHDIYVIATTVGYGDISAENTAERIVYVVMFIAGAVLWGFLLADLAEIDHAYRSRLETRMPAARTSAKARARPQADTIPT